MIEPLLLTTTQLATFAGNAELSRATGFYFERDARLFLITSRHVLFDEPSQHNPDRIEITVHTDAQDLTQSVQYSMPLYRNGLGLWRTAKDTGGEVDVGALESERGKLPKTATYHAFTPAWSRTAACTRMSFGQPLKIVAGMWSTLPPTNQRTAM